ncbi:5147_t:CDS:2 [Ambispora leptoticha]|uniref:5147_t:CDS:1 n=1 Tax=Ambispora leptoticha TaxID=144679 RepID=A0A9N9AI24_9GLOM|nr:5147_t:CDS:2 [Ambispora leptoticha]
MASNDHQEINIVYNEMQRVKERKVRLIILVFTGFLIVGYSIWNFWRMVEAIQSPVIIGTRNIGRAEIPVPGIVICGTIIDQEVQCYKGKLNEVDDHFTKVLPCEGYINGSNDATEFGNLRGFPNSDSLNCYILDSHNVPDKEPLKFNNSTQKIYLVLKSTHRTNNTQGAITNDEWYYFGVFNEKENPWKVKFQLVNMPAISYLYFKRTEKKQPAKIDAITGGSIGNTDFDSTADVELVTSFTTLRLSGIGDDANLWCVFQIIPQNYEFDETTFTRTYPVEISYKRIEFTFFQLTANMGGFVSILSALYFALLGSRRHNPWGIIQRYVLKSVPPPLTTDDIVQSSEKFYSTDILDENDCNDSQSHLRNQIQATARDIENLKLYLNKHYLRDIVPENR